MPSRLPAQRARLVVAAAVAVSASFAGSVANGQTSTWSQTTSGNWSTGSWTGTVPTVGGSSTWGLTFNNGGAYTATNDLTGVFDLNQLNFGQTASASTVIAGSGSASLRFTGTSPTINFGSAIGQDQTIASSLPIEFAQTVTINQNRSGSGILIINSAISGAGGLIKNGPGTLRLGAANTFAGGVTLNAGLLQLNNNSAASSITISGGSLGSGTTGINSAASLSFNVTPNFVTDNSPAFSGALSLTSHTGFFTSSGSGVTSLAPSTISGLNNTLYRVGAGTLSYESNFGHSGQTNLYAATTQLAGANGAFSATSEVNLLGGSLTFRNTAAANSGNRLVDSAKVYSYGGTINFTTDAGVNATESINDVSLLRGNLTINFTNDPGSGFSSTLTAATLTRATGSVATLQVTTPTASAAQVGAGRNAVVVSSGYSATAANEIIGPWATATASSSGAGDDWLIYGANGFARRNIATSAESTWSTAWVSTANFSVSDAATTLSASRTVNTLRQTGTTARAVTLNGFDLAAYGLLNGNGGGTTGWSFSQGTGGGGLTTPTGGDNTLYLLANRGAITIGVDVKDNGTAVNVVKSGTSALTISSNTNATGTLTVNQGSVALNGTSAWSTVRLHGDGGLTVGTAGALSSATTITVDSTGTLSTGSTAGRLNTGAAVTLNRGQLTVGANETIGSLAGSETAGVEGYRGTVALTGTLTVGNASSTSYSGTFSGTGALVKEGAGTLTLDGATSSTNTGTVTVNNGVLLLNKIGANALGGGTGRSVVVNNGGIVRWGTSATGAQIGGTNPQLILNTGGLVDLNGKSDTLAFSGNERITLAGGTIQTGTGVWTFGGNNASPAVVNGTSTSTISGNVNINGDRAVALSDNVVTGNGLELDWSANINAGLSLTLTAAAGTPSLRLAGSNAYTGATSIGSGVTLYADSTNALGTVAGNTTVAGGGTLVVRGGIVYAAEGLSLSFNTVTGLRSESGNNEWTGIITNPGGSSSTPASVQVVQDTLTVSATLAAFTSSRPFAKDGDGALVYTNAGNFGGLTVRGGVFAAAATTFSPSSALVLNGGVYAPSANFTRALGTAATNFNFGTNGGGFAAYNTAVSVNIGSLTTAVWGAGDGGTANFLPNAAPLILNSTISTAAVTFEDNLDLAAAAATFTGSREIRVLDNTASATDFAVISGAISTSKSGVGLTKTGAGVLVLSGTGTYDGTTAVSAGTLLVNGQLDNQASDVSIAGGARLGGTGTVYRPVTVAGTIAPGVGPGTLTIGDGTTSRNLTLAAGGSAEFEVGSTVAGTDLLAVNGSIDLAAASNRLTLVAVSGGPNGSVASYTILNATGGRTGDFEQVYVGNTAINVATAFDSAVGFVFGSGNYYLAWDSSSGGQLTLNAVPEPGMISVLGLAGAGLLRRRKRVA